MSTPAFAAEPVPAADLVGQMKAAAATLAAATAVAVQTEPADEPATSVAVTGGVDVTSLYMFRGFRQETDPAAFGTFQPWVDVGFSNDTAAFNLGVWNSAHTGSLKDAGAGWYETDFYASATVGMFKAIYTAYTYPNFDDSSVHELMLSASFDHMLAPSVGIAFEFAKPEGLDKGIYLEFGIAPTLTKEDAKATVTLPVKVGLSVKDYYGDDAFGYLSLAPTVVAPINDHFDVHGNLTVYALGDAAKAVNNDKRGQVTGTVGIGFSF